MSGASATSQTGKRLVSADPLNMETDLTLQRGLVTPIGQHYVRNHFMPSLARRQ
jgi:hypothetical protein